MDNLQNGHTSTGTLKQRRKSEPRSHDVDRQPDTPLTNFTIGRKKVPSVVVPSTIVPSEHARSVARRSVDDALNVQDVAALIINTMVGSGIYTTPPVVLSLTGSKSLSFGLWLLGFLFTITGMLIYLEYARRLPYTGGEIIYLDESLPKPRLLAYTIYSFYAIFIYNSATNSMQFASQVLVCISTDANNPNPQSLPLRFLAIVALTFFCLLHYFSRRVGRDLNQVLATIKIIFLLTVLSAGAYRVNHLKTKIGWNSNPEGDVGGTKSAVAFLYIMFSFSGWQNATFVTGEIPNHKTLRTGFAIAVILVGTLYLIVNGIFLALVDYGNSVIELIAEFFGGGYRAQYAGAAIVAISTTGSLLAEIYTTSRLKQTIGWSNILPWSRIWRSDSPQRLDENSRPKSRPTPQGGLMLHWISSVVTILGTIPIIKTSEAIGFAGVLQSYAQSWIALLISIGVPFLVLAPDAWILTLPSRVLSSSKWGRWVLQFFDERKIPSPIHSYSVDHPNRGSIEWHDWWPRIQRISYCFLALLYTGINFFVIVVPIIGPYEDSSGVKLQVKGWFYIAITVSVLFAGFCYYLLTFASANVLGDNDFQIVPGAPGEVAAAASGWSIASIADITLDIVEAEINDPVTGVRRSIQVRIPESGNASIAYTIFGGSTERHCAKVGISDLWNRIVARKPVPEPISDDQNSVDLEVANNC